MKNPYDVLGVNENATDDQIKKAYRALAKKYHPDNYDDSNPLKELAEEKMREVNEAYDAIRSERAGGKKSGGYSASGEFARIRVLINQGRYTEANRYLDMTEASKRNAEWYYLKGLMLIKRGYMMDGVDYLRRACDMDPNNTEYSDAYNAILRNSYSPYSSSRQPRSVHCSACDVCTALMCMNMCCGCGR